MPDPSLLPSSELSPPGAWSLAVGVADVVLPPMNNEPKPGPVMLAVDSGPFVVGVPSCA
jgi:hypothetical protein